MGEKKQYTSVSEVLGDIAPDKNFRAEFDEHIASRRIIKQLISLRAVQGLSQKDIAKKLACTQGYISKLENGRDSMAKLGDLQSFAEALSYKICVRLLYL